MPLADRRSEARPAGEGGKRGASALGSAWILPLWRHQAAFLFESLPGGTGSPAMLCQGTIASEFAPHLVGFPRESDSKVKTGEAKRKGDGWGEKGILRYDVWVLLWKGQ